MVASVTRPVHAVRQRAGHRREHGDLFVALLVLLAWVPVPLGSNRDWSVAILQAGALFLVGVWSLRNVYRPAAIPAPLADSRAVLTLLGAWLCVPLVQLLPLPFGIAGLVTGAAHSAYADIPGASPSGPVFISLDRGATFAGFLNESALVAIFLAVLVLAPSRRRIRALLVLFFALGCAQALYGLVLYVGGDGIGLWDPGHDDGSVSGTYVNQNHFAGLLEMTIPAGLGLLLMDRRRRETHRGLRGLLRGITSNLQGQRVVILFGLLVMLAALILSTSRGAVGSLGAAIALVVLLAALRRGSGARELRIGLVALVLAGFAVLWLGAGQLAEKLEAAGLASNRADLRELSYAMIAEAPIMGTGVGTYRWVLPPLKDERFGSGFYEHAHNDYLEVLGEQGIVGFGLLAAALGLVMTAIVRANARENDPFVEGALFASMVGCGSVLLHGLVDFNLQIPANAAYFAALLGVGAVAASLGKRSAW